VRKVEIDDEVFAFVQKHAEPLVDSFNSALRRVLASGYASLGERPFDLATGPVANREGDQIPPGTPQALRQILDVVRLVRAGSDTRRGATQQVAARLGVAPQTVVDKYTRQLGMTVAHFDRLLEPERLVELQKLLHAKFPEHAETVDQVLGAGITGWRTRQQAHLLDIADRFFGQAHGAELPIPRRGTAPHRPLPDFTSLERDR
jgi:hypothetical protein